jgi:hypothetical protein
LAISWPTSKTLLKAMPPRVLDLLERLSANSKEPWIFETMALEQLLEELGTKSEGELIER